MVNKKDKQNANRKHLYWVIGLIGGILIGMITVFLNLSNLVRNSKVLLLTNSLLILLCVIGVALLDQTKTWGDRGKI